MPLRKMRPSLLIRDSISIKIHQNVIFESIQVFYSTYNIFIVFV